MSFTLPRSARAWQVKVRAFVEAERFYRELRVDRIREGTSTVQRLIMARGLLKRGRAGVVDRPAERARPIVFPESRSPATRAGPAAGVVVRLQGGMITHSA